MSRKVLLVIFSLIVSLAAGAQTYQSVPYSTGFEGLSTGQQPTGWVVYQTGTNIDVTFPCAYNYSGNARNGNVYYEFEFSSGSATRYEQVATCEFADPSSLMVDFYASTISSYAPTLFEVGVMEDTTFVPVDTVTLTNASSFSSSSYYHYRVYLVDYTGDGHRIAFRATRSTSGQMTLFLDDMTISTAPSCSYMPGTPSATVDSNSATLTWANATVSAGYMLYLNNDNTWYNSSSNSYTFTGLNPNTQYNGYLYNNCTGSDTSEAVPFSFRTACGMTVLPLMENFDDVGSLPPCWNVTETSGSSPSIYGSSSHSSPYCLSFYSYSQPLSIATPLIYTDLNLLQVKFWGKRSSSYYSSSIAVGYTTSLDSIANATYVDTIMLGDNYTEYLMQFENAPASHGYIIFRKPTYSSDYGSAYIDDIEIGLAPTCLSMPGTPAVVTLDSTNATLRWNAAASGSYYALYLEQDSTWHNSFDTTYTFTSLNANTYYSGRLYNICAGGDTSNCTYFSFRTNCGTTILPLVEDFDSYGGEFPSCWRRTETSGSYPYLNTSAGRSGYGVYMYSYSDNLSFASPRIEQPINTIETKVWGRGSSTYYTFNLAVGYVANLDSVATGAVWVDTLTLSTTWEEYSVSFTHLNIAQGGYVVYRKLSGGYGTMYIDDITIREVSSCAVPQEIHTTGTASGQMSLAWTDTLGSTWEVVYGTHGMDPDTVTTNTLLVNTDTVTVTGLADSITYDFYVRAVCGGINSYWQGPVTARPNLYVMNANQTDTVYMCGGTITDDGGLANNYNYSQTSTLIVYPADNTQTVTLTGSYSTYSSSYPDYGQLVIYEGVGTNGRVLGTFAGSGTVNVSSLEGAATIRFTASGYSDYYTNSGYELAVHCVPLASCNVPYNVIVTDIAGSSATVNWDYGTTSTPQSFTIGVLDTATNSYTSYTVADTVRSLLVGGLSQTTTYYVTVRANCGGSDMSDTVGAYFTTHCYVGGEIQIGDGNVGLTSHPINSYYNYTICQVLYSNTEMAPLTDTIFGIKLYQVSGPNATRNVTIYLDTTSVTALNSGSDFVVMDSSKVVYTGTPTFHDGWNEFTFTTPWVRPSTTNNIVLTFDDNTGSWSSNTTWQGTGGQSGNTLYAYGDGTNYDPTSSNVTSQVNTTTNRPNVVFVAPCGDASCVPANVTVAATTSSSVTLNWMPGLNETSWSVEYRNANDTAWTMAIISTTAQTYTITGLYPNTLYNFRVGSLCSTNTVYSQVSARTDCAVMSRSTLPLNEDFEGYATGSVPNCWGTPVTGTSGSGTFPTCYNYSYNAYSGNVYFEMESSSGQSEIFTLPAIDTIDGLMVRFYAATYSYYAPTALEVGVWEGDSAFVPLDTVALNTSGYYNYDPYYVSINYNGTGNQIAFRSTGSGSYTIFMDDFTVYVPNPCDSVTNVVADTIGMSRLSFHWTDTANRGSYTVKINTTNNPATAIATATTTNTHYTFTGLTGLTTYYVWVYANCSVGMSDAATASAATLGSDPHYLPYYNDFEDTTNIFSVYQRSGSNTWYTGTAVNHGGTHAMYVTNDNGVSNAYTNSNQSISFAMTYLQIPYDSSYAISYDWRCQGEGSYDLMRLALVPEDYDFTNSFTSINRYSNTLPTGWIALDGGKRNLRNTWQHDENAVQVSAGNYYLTIVWINDGAMGTNPPAAIDNIQFSLLTCPAPENLVATATSSSTITASWDAGAASNWIIEYGVSGFIPGLGTFVGASTNSITLTGLAPVTAYDIYVRPVCSATDTGFVASTTCLTGCDDIINDFPWVEDFENGIACWEQYHQRGTVDWTTGRGGNAYGGLSGAATGQYNARFTCNSYDGYTTYLITPILNIPTEDEVMMTFYHAQPAWGSDQDTLAVLYRTHPDSSWHYVASWNSSIPTWQVDTVMLPNATATYQVAFMAHSGFGQGVLLDSIVIYGTESCTRPAFANVNIGPTSIAATWVGPASNYEVAIKPASTNVWPVPTLVNAHSYTFTNLEPNTTYNYRVRSLCNDTSISFWATSNCVTDTLTCYVPENVVVDGVDFQSVILSWRADVTAHAVAYVVNVFNSAFSSNDTVYNNHVTIMGLNSGVSYDVRIQAMCSATTYSDWSETVTFATPECQPVSDINISQITSNSAVVTWTPNGEESSWIVSYGYQGFDQGTGTDVTVNSPTCTITGLDYDMTYDVYVRAACTDEVFSHSYGVSFTTLSQTGIAPVDGSFDCNIYPNPTNSAATISVEGVHGRLLISVLDVTGRVVASEELWCNGAADCFKQVSVEGLAQGAYYVHIVANDVNMVRKLVVR